MEAVSWSERAIAGGHSLRSRRTEKVGHALRDAAARESLLRGSKKQDDDDKFNHSSWEDVVWQENMEPFDEEVSCTDLEWDGGTEDDLSLIPQKEVLEVFQEFRLPPQPDWTPVDCFLQEMMT
jgi:hypothetical protein